ncbi:MAG TPA: amidohydrolase [Candidatus Copromorpha excrementigallinarum]|uniref:Amidohydrolase n=1 Tax=Candidatus Allocopromorpha excrementigallinarum TaxID=2840742 RepID=A0A9D1I0U2_9FIRM|nr:amidohydrolase [Candidatus Copromorpha excrementigallinarum]
MNRLLFYNGRIRTMDSDRPEAECMAVEGERIRYLGDLKGAPGDEEYEKIDLAGRTIMPSFIDAHLHLGMTMDVSLGLDLTECETVEDYRKKIKEHVRENPGAEVIKGFGWHDRSFGDKGPDKKILDEIVSHIPVALAADSLHSLWVNSRALEMAGINAKTEDLKSGSIERYHDGEPSGVIKEDCMTFISRAIPDYSVDQYKKVFEEQISYLNTLGFTGFYDAKLEVNSNGIEALKELARENKLKGYMQCVYFMYPFMDIDKQISSFVEARKRDNISDGFSVNSVKVMLDGVIESRTGYLKEPYLDSDGNPGSYRGIAEWEQEDLNKGVFLAMKNGFQVEAHCIGDGALEQAIKAFEYAESRGLKGRRNKISHIELVSDGDTERMKALEIVPCLSPYWAQMDDLYFAMLDFVGKERADRIWPVNSLIRAGLICSTGSDYPITEVPNPFVGIEIGMTRKIPRSYHPWAVMKPFEAYKQLGPDSEKAGLYDMVKMYTSGSAYSMHMDHITGSLKTGKNADFIIADKDIFTAPTEEISETKVVSTYFKGRQVYDARER